jgi:sugar phosphate isomerase/epimerase
LTRVERGLVLTPIPNHRQGWLILSASSFYRCFSTLGCPELDLDGVVALALSRRIESVELRALNGTIDLIAQFTRAFGSPAELKAWAARGPIRVAMIGTSFRLHGNGAADRDALLALVGWAEALGTRWLRVFDGCKSGDAGEIADAVAMLAWWAGERRRRGFVVDLATETHDATADPVALRTFLTAAPECRILWDAHHTWRRGGEMPGDTWLYLKPHVVHVHFKDSATTPGVGEGYAYVPPGDGEFPLGALVDQLAADGYAGALCLEWERMWHPALAPIETALDRLDRFPWWNAAAAHKA